MANTSPIRVLIAGCSYGGISAVVNLIDLCQGKRTRYETERQPHAAALGGFELDVHIVDERDGYYHLIGSPLAFASSEYATKAWVRFEDIPALRHPCVRCTRGSLSGIDTNNLVASIVDSKTGEQTEHRYDYFVAATGLRRIWPVVPQSLTKRRYQIEIGEHVRSIRNAVDGVIVIGGGAVGIEMAAELKLVQPGLKVTLIHSRDKLLSAEPLPEELKDVSLKTLKEHGVNVILGRGRVAGQVPITNTEGRQVQMLTLEDGSHVIASHVINAISQSVPSTSYLPPSTLDARGLVKIDSHLKFLDGGKHDDRHYAVGDLVSWSGIKRCGGAMAMGSRAADNIHQQILFEQSRVPLDLTEWPEVPPMIAMAIGTKAAVYDPVGGVKCSEEMMKIFFGGDLGFDQCYHYLKLGEGW